MEYVEHLSLGAFTRIGDRFFIFAIIIFAWMIVLQMSEKMSNYWGRMEAPEVLRKIDAGTSNIYPANISA